MAEWPTDDELVTAVRSAGWLLEHHALRVLADAGMHPRTGWAFADPDEPTKSRELDVWAYRRVLHARPSAVSVSATFLVECKQSAKPYVGVGYELPAHMINRAPAEHVLAVDNVNVPLDPDHRRYRVDPAWKHFGFDEIARTHRPSPFRVTQLTRLDRSKGGGWNATNEGIFTSLVYPLAKALMASKVSARRSFPSPEIGMGGGRTRDTGFTLHFPVVLVSCPLYVVDATHSEPRVEQRPWATATRELKSRSVTGTFEIDVVTEKAFADYVADRLAFAQAFADKIAADPLHYTGEKGDA